MGGLASPRAAETVPAPANPGRNGEDALTALQQAGDDLRLDREPGLAQGKLAEELGADDLMTGHQVMNVNIEQDIRGQRDELIAHHKQERMARITIEGTNPTSNV